MDDEKKKKSLSGLGNRLRTFFQPAVNKVNQVRNDFRADFRPGGYVGFTGDTAQGIRNQGVKIKRAVAPVIQGQKDAFQNDPSAGGIISRVAAGAVNEGVIKPSLKAVRSFSDFMNPQKTRVALSREGLSRYGSGMLNAGKVMMNTIAAPRTAASTYVASGGIGAGANAIFGDKNQPLQKRLESGASSGMSTAPALGFISRFTNPVVNRVASKVVPQTGNKALNFILNRGEIGRAHV